MLLHDDRLLMKKHQLADSTLDKNEMDNTFTKKTNTRIGGIVMVTAQQLSTKFELLDPFQRQTVSTFIDFLLRDRPVVKASDKKAILLRTSVWSEESIQQIEKVRKELNQWKVPTF